MIFSFLAPQSGALRINAFRDFYPSNPIHPLIAFEHLSLSIVIWDSACRPRQINVDQGRPKQVSILQVSKYPSVQVSQVSKYPSIQVSQVCKCTSIQVTQVCKYPKYASTKSVKRWEISALEFWWRKHCVTPAPTPLWWWDAILTIESNVDTSLKLEGPRPMLRVLPTPLVNLEPRNSSGLNTSRCMRGATYGKKPRPSAESVAIPVSWTCYPQVT